jgi:hypothetical protein
LTVNYGIYEIELWNWFHRLMKWVILLIQYENTILRIEH